MIYFIGILVLITAVYFCSITFIIIGFNNINKDNYHELSDVEVKKISIIIPVRNEESNIIQCLESLKEQNYKMVDFEVIVINDHSTDNTQNVINSFISANEMVIGLYSLDNTSSKKEALKYGVEKSKYNIIATSDADCVLPKDWLKNISAHLDDTTDMLLGPIMFKKQKGFLSSFQMLDMMAIQGIEFGALHYQKPILNNAANLSYLKESFLNVGGFDSFNTPSGDDIFLLEKFKSTGKKIKGVLTQDFIVETKPECSFYGLMNQRLRWSSKAMYYSDRWLIYISSIVLIQNVSLIFIYLGIPLVEKYRIILIILLFCKWLIDFILLLLVAYFFKRKKALFYYIPVQIVYPIYTVLIWIVSMTTKFEWKGRKF